MKTLHLFIAFMFFIALSVPSQLLAASHGHGDKDHGHGHGDMAKGQGCQYCGMNLVKFAHAATYITYDDGSVQKLCSIHCAAIDMSLNLNKAPEKIEVGDFNTREKIDAEKAYWVLDNSRPGVMTMRAKWAFQNKADAEAYIAKKGGKLISFEEAIEATYMDMYKDTKMIRNKRKMMREKKMKMQH